MEGPWISRRSGDARLAPLLYLCHRIPFPPNKGDKVRSYNILRFLRHHFRIYLGAFVDDPADWRYVEELADLCDETCLLPLDPLRARFRSLRSLVSSAPLTVPYYADNRMHEWVSGVVSRAGIRRAMAFSSAMAQYLEAPGLEDARKVVDFVDVDSEKWAQFAQRRSSWEAWVYRRESRALAEYEHTVARRSTASVFISDAEVEVFRHGRENVGARILTIPNGVDAGYFKPDDRLPTPYSVQEGAPEAIAFTGAMDYWPNVDAVDWFAKEVLPAVLVHRPHAHFYIVGSNPSAKVRSLASAHVTVTGRVADIRPFLNYARVVVAPMRVARGIQNKVLEAMAMAKSLVTTRAGLEGLTARAGSEVLVAESAQEFASSVVATLVNPDGRMGAAARNRVVSDYSWSAVLKPFEELLR
ncbi:MAG: TIGR03087 family PEP-CTERM/XrtA system glycosyltransferase [Roseibium album]|uniref:TIGR03087 family PEP-CTERM/XrtA system glycosyltransferase n=1 Tax=Roseibium album TaxID=311410 RepID=UPI0032EE1C74